MRRDLLGRVIPEEQPEVFVQAAQFSGMAFYDSPLVALQQSQQSRSHSGQLGMEATLPMIIAARNEAAFDDAIWRQYFTANTEEFEGRTKRGTPVVVVVHGSDLQTVPRVPLNYRGDGVGIAQFTEGEFQRLVGGQLPDGRIIPVYTATEVREGGDFPDRYAVVVDHKEARWKYMIERHPIRLMEDDLLYIARVGGIENAMGQISRLEELGKWGYINKHPFTCDVPDIPVGRMVNVHGIDNVRMFDIDLDGMINGSWDYQQRARYIAAIPREAQAAYTLEAAAK